MRAHLLLSHSSSWWLGSYLAFRVKPAAHFRHLSHDSTEADRFFLHLNSLSTPRIFTMNSNAFRAALRSTTRLGQHRAAMAAPRQTMISLRQTARSYASSHGTTTAHHTNSDAAWVVKCRLSR